MVNLLTPFAIDAFEPIAKWLALSVVGACLIAGVLVFILKRALFPKFAKYTLFGLFVFLLVLGICCLSMEIAKKYSQSYADENGIDPLVIAKYLLIPITCLLAILLISAIVIALVYKKSSPETVKANLKKTTAICALVCLIAIVFVGIMLGVYFKTVKDWYPNLNQTVLYISSGMLIVLLIALAFILDKSDKPFDTRCIAMAGITVAMSFGLSYIKLWEMPQGGSVTLMSLLPIMIFSYVYGTKKGVFVCFIYGVLQAIQDPWIIHPAQFLLDYPIAFAFIGLSGAFAKIRKLENLPQVSFLLGGILASVLRFLSHFLSGVFAFPSADMSPYIFSLAYNSFVFVDIAIVLIAGAIVFSSKAFIKELNK